jgi:hypothetical protein
MLLGGIVAATVDIGAACVISGRNLPFILHAIAGGVLAQASFDGGARTAILGAILQEVMGVIIAAVYVIAARSVPILERRWIAAGLAYGVVIFFVMNYVVVPLSAWKEAPHFSTPGFAKNMLAMLLFGLIVAFFAHRAADRVASD